MANQVPRNIFRLAGAGGGANACGTTGQRPGAFLGGPWTSSEKMFLKWICAEMQCDESFFFEKSDLKPPIICYQSSPIT